jgi:hypothetical protein
MCTGGRGLYAANDRISNPVTTRWAVAKRTKRLPTKTGNPRGGGELELVAASIRSDGNRGTCSITAGSPSHSAILLLDADAQAVLAAKRDQRSHENSAIHRSRIVRQAHVSEAVTQVGAAVGGRPRVRPAPTPRSSARK